ncbi:hypothetical protein SISNIDRAFT_56709 [Sistotremastrum niveocremeum HHB9708]|uniref:Uncharacterized protein n=2 Tax=Sistotremastraceae TaxID=3402574 RepID=A0A164VDJ8_9AGAM|nr:hypothetical protein SISNIDRAFT_56709 [Sistotremastrum niveocremeum HHB9708]KZT33862.1 hypothetical protein SISSUDRAFT_377313 [Sistotremastrum suecicum HHB10207 ss-3]
MVSEMPEGASCPLSIQVVSYSVEASRAPFSKKSLSRQDNEGHRCAIFLSPNIYDSNVKLKVGLLELLSGTSIAAASRSLSTHFVSKTTVSSYSGSPSLRLGLIGSRARIPLPSSESSSREKHIIQPTSGILSFSIHHHPLSPASGRAPCLRTKSSVAPDLLCWANGYPSRSATLRSVAGLRSLPSKESLVGGCARLHPP